MNLDFTPEENAFRDEVRTFIKDNYPAELRKAQDEGRALTKEEYLLWHKVLAKKGWVAPSWPKELGGTDWTPTQKYIWSEETARADCLGLMPFGLSMLAPVLYTFGTDEQKKRFLPGIYNGEVWWCQGYSEPGAGSDLASLKTRAERVKGDDGKEYYIVNGQKTWTTLEPARRLGLLPGPHRSRRQAAGGHLVPADRHEDAGITVRPIITLEGGHEVNDVFLDNVKVPVENRIFHEPGLDLRQGAAGARAQRHRRRGALEAQSREGARDRRHRAVGHRIGAAGRRLLPPKVAELEIDLSALEFTELRTLAGESSGKGPGPESSILKIKGTEIQQRLQELALEAVSHYGAPFLRDLRGSNVSVGPDYADGLAGEMFNGRKTSIYGGSNEIQRNIIAKAVLGL